MSKEIDLAEWANQMSEALFGYREASENEMLQRVRELKEIEREHLLNKYRGKVAKAVYNLIDVIEEIEHS